MNSYGINNGIDHKTISCYLIRLFYLSFRFDELLCDDASILNFHCKIPQRLFHMKLIPYSKIRHSLAMLLIERPFLLTNWAWDEDDYVKTESDLFIQNAQHIPFGQACKIIFICNYRTTTLLRYFSSYKNIINAVAYEKIF